MYASASVCREFLWLTLGLQMRVEESPQRENSAESQVPVDFKGRALDN